MSNRTIIILEDDEDRIRDFKSAIAELGPDYQLRLWRDAPTMAEECLFVLKDCCLISLDHDLNPVAGALRDPGTGLEIAELLARQSPVCPVILHTSNGERRWSMHNELRFAGWAVEIVAPLDAGWITTSWLSRVRALLQF